MHKAWSLIAGGSRVAATALAMFGAMHQPTAATRALDRAGSTSVAASCAPLPADWLGQIPGHQRRIMPTDCSRIGHATQLFSWGEPNDRATDKPFTLSLRGGDDTISASHYEVGAPRLILEKPLESGDYEWAVSYTNLRGARLTTQWRRFNVDMRTTNASSSGSAANLPSGNVISKLVEGRDRPRVVPMGSSFERIKAAAQGPDHLPVLNALRTNALLALKQPTPPEPALGPHANATEVAQFGFMVHRTAVFQRQYIEILALVGQMENNLDMRVAAKQKLLALAEWSPAGTSGEKANDHANREIYVAIATGLDLLWDLLSTQERANLVTAARTRILDAHAALAFLDREPYESHRLVNVRGINQALMLLVGTVGFPEASNLLVQTWNLSRFTLSAWGDRDGSFGNGIAYAWYAFTSGVPYAAAVRVISGLNLYEHSALRLAGDQLMAFTAPNHSSPSAFGDGAEVADLYKYFAGNHYRLHAQMTRNPVDAWYWQVNPSNIRSPNQPQIWQLLLLGVDAAPLPAPRAPAQHSWYSADAGLAAVHIDSAKSMRTSLFFRSSRFGAFNHSHADQNSVVYISQGQPLLINAGYYPYYNSPHHKAVTRATRYQNALTFDGGIGQSERSTKNMMPTKPTEPVHSMDASGALVRAEDRGQLAVLTGDATAAYRALDTQSGQWTPLLSNAVRSVVVDRANGVVLIYDWATSDVPRRWELNFHSPKEFAELNGMVKASNNGSSLCLERFGPAGTFAQTSKWDIAPETAQPTQAHGRFTLQEPTTELAHLTVLLEGCHTKTVRVQLFGSRIHATVGQLSVSFEKRDVTIHPDDSRTSAKRTK